MPALLLALALPIALAQDTAPRPLAPEPAPEALRVFLDCPACDFDFLRTEIRFVNYVRDRTVADVHVLVTTQGAGSGTEYTFTFIGLGAHAGRTDTLRQVTSQTDTSDEVRRAVARVLTLGLVRYVADTPLASRLEIRYRAPDGEEGPSRRGGRDPWNYWVFEISGSVDFDGEESQRSRSYDGSLEASRITEAWKIALELNGDYRRTSFELDDTTSFTTKRTSWDFEAIAARSVGDHWAWAAWTEIEHSSFRNLDVRLRVAPGIEYDVFPYSESTRRILTLRYLAGIEHARYQDTTIFSRLSETRPAHALEASFSARQPWGSSSISLDFFQYLHDTRKLNVSFYVSANIRIVRGLSFRMYGGYDVVRDQLYLPAAGATAAEIIAEQRALATNYSYYTGFGLSYTFGSIYNNVVNPRFR